MRTRLDRFLLRVRAKEGETATSLLARLAARHRDEDLAAFARDGGLTLRALALGHGVERLARMAGIDEAALLRSAPKADPRARRVALGHGVVALGDWTSAGLRYCEHCVASDRTEARAAGRDPATEAYRRFWWDIGSVDRCPDHHVRLVASCRRCGEPRAWGNVPGACRSCGASLGRRTGSPRPEAAAFERYVVDRLLGETTSLPLADDLEVTDVVAQVGRLGLAVTAGLSRFKPRRSALTPDVRAAGFAALLEWPRAFEGALDRLVAQARLSDARPGLIGTYGWVYEHWAAGLDPAVAFGAAVRRCLRAHAVRYRVIPENEPALDGPPLPATTITGAARALGWGFARTRKVAHRRGLVPDGARRGVAIPLHPGAPEILREGEDGCITISEAGRLLGVGKTQAGRLTAAGLLGEVAPGRGAKIRRGACEALITRLLAQSRRANVDAMRRLPLPRACQAYGISLDAACARILAGELAVEGGVPGRGLAGILVAEAAIRRPTRADGLTIAEAARSLDLHHEAARHLVRRKLLATVGEGNKRRVDPNAIGVFRAAFVTGADLARSAGVSPRAMADRLRARGIAPIAGPPDCRQTIFCRSAARAVLCAEAAS